jgi:anion-transporting  ArsA/GET3 family ATPase
MTLNQTLIKTLGIIGLTFLIVGLILQWFFAVPSMTILIDRSYCPPTQWAKVTQQYQQLYTQQQQQSIQIKSIVLFSDLAEEVRWQRDRHQMAPLPLPQDIQMLNTYGQHNAAYQANLEATHRPAKVLGCSV